MLPQPQMIAGLAVAVVVPAWNEAPRIGAVLRTMPAGVDRVIVVDDGSTDATAKAARRAAGGDDVDVIVHRTNRGVGAAIATGYRHMLRSTCADVCVVMAGDGQMDPADLLRLVEPIARGEADYVKGNRFLDPDVRSTMPFARRLGGALFSRLTSWAIGVPISDSQCGYTIIARSACALLDLPALWPGYGYPNDLLAQLVERGARIAEVPVRAVYGPPSKLRLWHVGHVAWVVTRAWIRARRARREARRRLAG